MMTALPLDGDDCVHQGGLFWGELQGSGGVSRPDHGRVCLPTALEV